MDNNSGNGPPVITAEPGPADSPSPTDSDRTLVASDVLPSDVPLPSSPNMPSESAPGPQTGHPDDDAVSSSSPRNSDDESHTPESQGIPMMNDALAQMSLQQHPEGNPSGPGTEHLGSLLYPASASWRRLPNPILTRQALQIREAVHRDPAALHAWEDFSTKNEESKSKEVLSRAAVPRMENDQILELLREKATTTAEEAQELAEAQEGYEWISEILERSMSEAKDCYEWMCSMFDEDSSSDGAQQQHHQQQQQQQHQDRTWSKQALWAAAFQCFRTSAREIADSLKLAQAQEKQRPRSSADYLRMLDKIEAAVRASVFNREPRMDDTDAYLREYGEHHVRVARLAKQAREEHGLATSTSSSSDDDEPKPTPDSSSSSSSSMPDDGEQQQCETDEQELEQGPTSALSPPAAPALIEAATTTTTTEEEDTETPGSGTAAVAETAEIAAAASLLELGGGK
ncbi:hypothetical protein QBC47DRAFT_399223 [Echria macrotheca]|uniref:Uncharacterized protein n=1 Tax=Echria macrotheca TaxID=438768 RepID=A0AAJ0BHZ0_9PEZI|nr:hypothetical protein QBC47DRAFT_399223 [Echria macrotheca]